MGIASFDGAGVLLALGAVWLLFAGYLVYLGWEFFFSSALYSGPARRFWYVRLTATVLIVLTPFAGFGYLKWKERDNSFFRLDGHFFYLSELPNNRVSWSHNSGLEAIRISVSIPYFVESGEVKFIPEAEAGGSWKPHSLRGNISLSIRVIQKAGNRLATSRFGNLLENLQIREVQEDVVYGLGTVEGVPQGREIYIDSSNKGPETLVVGRLVTVPKTGYHELSYSMYFTDSREFDYEVEFSPELLPAWMSTKHKILQIVDQWTAAGTLEAQHRGIEIDQRNVQ